MPAPRTYEPGEYATETQHTHDAWFAPNSITLDPADHDSLGGVRFHRTPLARIEGRTRVEVMSCDY